MELMHIGACKNLEKVILDNIMLFENVENTKELVENFAFDRPKKQFSLQPTTKKLDGFSNFVVTKENTVRFIIIKVIFKL